MEFSFSDDVNLESTVLSALSKLQAAEKFSKKVKQSAGVACTEVVKFLKDNYSWVDGDVESQVMTALLSCVKTGFVCLLNNRKYLLLGPTPSKMISNCATRVSHGPKCSCLSAFEWSQRLPRNCCVVKNSEPLIKKPKKGPKRKKTQKPKPQKRTMPLKKKQLPNDEDSEKQSNCVLIAQNMMGTSKSSMSFGKLLRSECNYCFKDHPAPKLRTFCTSCYPSGKLGGVPDDNFSPRDEPQLRNVEKNCEKLEQ